MSELLWTLVTTYETYGKEHKLRVCKFRMGRNWSFEWSRTKGPYADSGEIAGIEGRA